MDRTCLGRANEQVGTFVDDVGSPAEPVELYTHLAVKHGVIRPGETLDQMVIDMVAEVVDRCAAIGYFYCNREIGGNAGEHIREVLLPN